MGIQVESIAEHELGASAHIVGRIEEGLIHDTYEVRVDGERFILQISDADPEREAALARGLCCYRLLQDSEIPVPCPVTEEVREFNGRNYVIVENRPGTIGECDISPERTRNAGERLAEIHDTRGFEVAGRLRVDAGELSLVGFEEGSETAWRRRKLRDNARFLRDGGLEEAGREVETHLDKDDLAAREGSPTVLCHNDFTPDNILYEDDVVTGVLDFDHVYAGNAFRDVAKAATGFWMHDPGADWGVREAFYDGYRQVGELGRSFEETEPMYRVETLAVSVGGMANMGELSTYERNFYGNRICEAIERIRRG